MHWGSGHKSKVHTTVLVVITPKVSSTGYVLYIEL